MILTAIAIAAASTAAVPQDDTSWVRMDSLPIPAVHPSTKDQPGPLLTCSEGKIGLVIAIKDGDFQAVIDDSSKRRRKLSGSIMVDGEETYEGVFSYKPSASAAQAFERKPAAQVFNAIVRGQEVDFKLSGKGETSLSLPAMDDTFKTFAAECKAQKTA